MALLAQSRDNDSSAGFCGWRVSLGPDLSGLDLPGSFLRQPAEFSALFVSDCGTPVVDVDQPLADEDCYASVRWVFGQCTSVLLW